MRAADALFSPSPDGGSSNGTAIRTAPNGSGDPSTLSRPALDPIVADTQPAISTEAPSPEKTGGRILRAIDEPPSPQYAALEAERAPKRRGRKPGSKNRPKVPAVSVEVPSAASSAAATVAPTAATQPAAVQIAAIMDAPNASLRGAKRFPWVRDRLKPGEDWKRRRLPRVCW